MKRGLVIGKFLPLTNGHVSLIEFGANNCDELNVLVCSLKEEPIDGWLRYIWVQKHFESNNKIKVDYTDEELPNAPTSDREVSKIWAKYLKEIYPDINIIFGSEKYVEYVAEYMGIDYKIYDEDRTIVPISATMIRENPYKYWDMIPEVVKPYFVKKVCIYGPDSCGKSTLTKKLAEYYNTAYVPEIADCMINWGNLNINNLNIYHLEKFAELHSNAVNTMTQFANKILFVDTDNTTTQIYSDVYCGSVPDVIKDFDNIKYDYYLLLNNDTPYVEENQRNLKDRREEMMDRFCNELFDKNIPYTLISGDWEKRFNMAKSIIDELLK